MKSLSDEGGIEANVHHIKDISVRKVGMTFSVCELFITGTSAETLVSAIPRLDNKKFVDREVWVGPEQKAGPDR